MGLLYDNKGDSLTPVYTKKTGKRYRYYVSRRLTLGEADEGSGWRLPAERIERHVITKLKDLLAKPAKLMDILKTNDINQGQLQVTLDAASKLAIKLSNLNPQSQREVILSLVERIELYTDKLVMSVNANMLRPDMGNAEEPITLEYGLVQKRKGAETRLVLGGTPLNTPDLKLIEIVAKAREWHNKLTSKNYAYLQDIAAEEKIDKADVSRTLPLVFLAPSIIRAIISGHQPLDLTAHALRRKSSRLPLCWTEQRAYLGFKV